MKKQKENADQQPRAKEKAESQRIQNMSESAKVIASYLGDITELSIVEDSGRIERIQGVVVVDDAHYRISLRTHHWANPDTGDKPKYRYTGTISMLSPIGREVLRSEVRKRRLQDSGKADLKEKDYYASSPYYTNKTKAEDIAKDIRAIVQDLYDENKDQFEEEFGRHLPTDKLTPKHALSLYLGKYLPAISFFFADPYAPWQRGTNENTNGLLRECVPKSADISAIPDAVIQQFVDSLNRRPRKCLGWLSPYEIFFDSTLHLT